MESVFVEKNGLAVRFIPLGRFGEKQFSSLYGRVFGLKVFSC